jgi:hypothetical protein
MRFPAVEVVQVEDGQVPPVTASVRAAGPHCPPVTGRWLNQLHLPALVNVDAPTCEEMERGSYHRPGPISDVPSGGPIGARGRPGRAVRTRRSTARG